MFVLFYFDVWELWKNESKLIQLQIIESHRDFNTIYSVKINYRGPNVGICSIPFQPAAAMNEILWKLPGINKAIVDLPFKAGHLGRSLLLLKQTQDFNAKYTSFYFLKTLNISLNGWCSFDPSSDYFTNFINFKKRREKQP